jgi:hypothetical protein
MAVFLLIGKTSALTMNIAGVVKDWMLIGLSVALFKSAVTSLNLFGYFIAFLAVCWCVQLSAVWGWVCSWVGRWVGHAAALISAEQEQEQQHSSKHLRGGIRVQAAELTMKELLPVNALLSPSEDATCLPGIFLLAGTTTASSNP